MTRRRLLAVAADHAGAALKAELLAALDVIAPDWEAIDLGGDGSDPDDDYPDAARAVATALRTGLVERGLLLCGSGIGVAIAANKFRGIRAASVHDPAAAASGVVDDAMNVLALGGRRLGLDAAAEVLEAFLTATPSRDRRHLRRRAKLVAIEEAERAAPSVVATDAD